MEVSTAITVLTICSFVADVAAIQCWKCNDDFGTVKDTGEVGIISSGCIHGISEEECTDGDVCVTYDMSSSGVTQRAQFYDKKIDLRNWARECGPKDMASSDIDAKCDQYKGSVRFFTGGTWDEDTFNCERKTCETDLCNNDGNKNLATATGGEDGADGSGGEDGAIGGGEDDKKDSYSAGGKMETSILLVLGTFAVFCNII